MEAVRIGLDAMALKDLGHDLRHRQVLENSLVVAELQVVQGRHQGQLITGQASTGLAHEHILDMPVNAFAIEAKLKKGGLAEQALQIEIRVLADQFNMNGIQGTDRLNSIKRQDLEVVANRRDE